MITQHDIDELLAFLPRLEAQHQKWITSWSGGGPNYLPEVEAFFQFIHQDPWLDHHYNPVTAGDMLRNDHLLATANWTQVKQMLTFCARSERFSSGAWASWLESGKMVRLLHRIRELGSENR